jgi:GTP-binding protein LepA
MDTKNIRNFCIIAHIDHGKSTLADRLMELTQTVSSRERKDQLLDSMDLERERGITIKASSVTMRWTHEGTEYLLNLIDTPGHVDFSYEVSRALKACEGALLLVDAAQGIEAQTVANFYLALEADLTMIPVINKIDLPHARPDEVAEEIHKTLGLEPHEVVKCSAKTGTGVEDVLKAVVERIPPPKGDAQKPLRALIFDSHFDDYRGVIVYVRVFDGLLKSGDRITMLGAGTSYEVLDVGLFTPQMVKTTAIESGCVGFFIANIKNIGDVRVGDTVTHRGASVEPLVGYKEAKPMVFCGIYPTFNNEFEFLRKALDKLHLNDSSFSFEPETSEALGFGFRCGFLGLLHMEIVQERLERESDIDLVQTAPNVTYEIVKLDGTTIEIDNPSDLPSEGEIAEFREPIVRVSLIVPAFAIGALMQICTEKRGRYKSTEYISADRVLLTYDMPLAEIIFDFYDMLKSATRGYGTMDYQFLAFEPGDLVRLRILVGGQEVDALSAIVHRSNAEYIGRNLIGRLKKEIPRHMFEVPLQAAIGGKFVARDNIKPLRKNVIAKCYGGDITRKRKLLEKQKEGKRRMKQVGNVEIPQKAFLAVLSAYGKSEE